MIRQPYPDSYARYTYETIEAHFENSRIKTLSRLVLINVDSLYLDHNEIVAIDPGIFVKIKTLKTLSIKDNNLQTLDERSFNGLTHLKHLDLSHNKLHTLDENSFHELRNLESLDLSHNKLTNLMSRTFSALHSLKILSLSHNAIENLEGEIFSLPKLQTLDVSFNSILQIGLKVFDKAHNLRILNVSNNIIAKIDDYKIASLETLDLSCNNNVTVDPNAFTSLKSLKWLSLASNKLEEVPPKVEMLAELRVLHLEENAIKDLGDSVKKLRLEEFYVQDNNLQNFDVNAERLRVLNLSSNKLTSFPTLTYSALEFLDLSSNQLSAIPDGLMGLYTPALTSLTLDDNPMKEVRFPIAGKEEQDGDFFVNLTWVSLSHMSELRQLEAGAFSGLGSPCGECHNGAEVTGMEEAELVQTCNRKLVVRVAHNPHLDRIDADAFKDVSMCSLDLSYNAVSFLHEEVTNWESLESANLQGNPWDCTCRLQWVLDKVLPLMYKTSQQLLYELRCETPFLLRNKRMVHFYSWKNKAFCTEKEQLRAATETTDTNIDVSSSGTMIYIIAGLGALVLILVIIGIVWQRHFDNKYRSRRNRRF
jgi:Leucine-rich repeat (LRR) protein